jgi:iron complex transport system substrate-binding protein
MTGSVAEAPATTAAQFPLTFTDDSGRSVTLKAIPRRIVSLSPSNTEIVFALGLGDELVGDTTYCNYPKAAQSLPKIGGFSNVDIEKVVSLAPDLILAANIHEAQIIPSLLKLNIPIMTLEPKTIPEIFNDINRLGAITGQAAEAKALTAGLQKRVEAVAARTAGVTRRPRVLYITWHDPIYAAGDDTINGQLIKMAGGDNISKDLKGYATLSLESVIERNPQIIVVMSSMGDQTSTDYINSEPRLKATDALKNKRVYSIDADLFGRTTPRVVDALEKLESLVQGEIKGLQNNTNPPAAEQY